LMLVPILLGWPTIEHAQHQMAHASSLSQAASSPGLLLAAVGVHTLSLLLVTGAVAILVYEKLGLALLRQVWFNFDLLWAAALLIAGVMALVLS
jgi:hypothetical protein